MARKHRRQGPKDQGIAHSFRALKHRDFAIFWAGALVSNTGGWLTNLAVPFVLYEMTGSALWVGLASVAQFLPGVLLGPWGGSLADRSNRRTVLYAAQLGLVLSTALMWAVWAAGFHDPVLLLFLVALIGIFSGVNMPSWQAYVADLVPRGDLISAVTLNSLQFNAARSLGPAIAGVLLAALGPAWAFFLNAVAFVFVIIALSLVRTRPPAPSTAGPGIMRDFLRAGAYAWRHDGILLVIVLSVVVGMLGNPVFQLTVVVARDVLEAGPIGLGLLNAALGFGAVVAAPLVSGWNKVFPTSKVVAWGLVLYGAAMAWFGLTAHFTPALVSLVVVGACFLAVTSGLNTALQLLVDDRMRGRVIAVRHIFYVLSFPAGAMLQGWLADLWGVQATLVAAGTAMALAVAAIALRGGRLRFARLDQHDGGPSRTAHATV